MKTRALSLLGTSMLLVLAGCSRQEQVREIDWAKAALARNPAFEIVATDESAGIFTVRDTTTGLVQTLRLEDLIATPRAAKVAAQPPEPTSAPTSAPDSVAQVEAAGPPAPEAAHTDADDQTTGAATSESPGDGASLASGPGYSIRRAAEVATPAPVASLEGPGYSITRHEAQAGQSGPKAEDQAAAMAANANVERRTDPIICQGDRLMRVDGETLEFSGDAIIAEEGCDLFISNANIRAGGVGIIARRARVHIVNSTIGGTRGSYEASEGAEIYVARTTFSGIGRRFDSATMNDLGGNAYNLTHE